MPGEVVSISRLFPGPARASLSTSSKPAGNLFDPVTQPLGVATDVDFGLGSLVLHPVLALRDLPPDEAVGSPGTELEFAL